jgi:serine/threonine protein kinase
MLTNSSFVCRPFVWYVAEAMARAGIAMHHGVAIRQGEELAAREGSWDDIIHRDLKPSNVFLEFPLAATYPYYRTPILGDYGLAVKTNENDNYLNPQFYRGVGTKGFYAPE